MCWKGHHWKMYFMKRFIFYYMNRSFKGNVNSTNKVKLWNIKHQSRLKVLHKFYYSKRDVSATLVETVFKLIKVQPAKPSLNTKWRQISVECFHFFFNRGFHAFVLKKLPLSLLNTLSCQYLTTTISISNDSLTFLS